MFKILCISLVLLFAFHYLLKETFHRHPLVNRFRSKNIKMNTSRKYKKMLEDFMESSNKNANNESSPYISNEQMEMEQELYDIIRCHFNE